MEASQPQQNSITGGVIWKTLLSFFFPILLGTFFQQLYNTADAVIVGQYVGKQALAAVGEGVKVLAIDGVRPSEEAIQAGEYPICRSFYLVTAGEEGLSPAARDFLDYAQGPGAEPYLRAAGAVPPARSASGREGYP